MGCLRYLLCCMLMMTPLVAGAAGAHAHTAKAGMRLDANLAVSGHFDAGSLGAPAPALAVALPGCHPPGDPAAGRCVNPLTHSCCSGITAVHIAEPASAIRRVSEQNARILRLLLLPRAQRIFHPPRALS